MKSIRFTSQTLTEPTSNLPMGLAKLLTQYSVSNPATFKTYQHLSYEHKLITGINI